jgi:hypothetical protein
MAKMEFPRLIYVRRSFESDGSSFLEAWSSADEIPECESGEGVAAYFFGGTGTFHVEKRIDKDDPNMKWEVPQAPPRKRGRK